MFKKMSAALVIVSMLAAPAFAAGAARKADPVPVIKSSTVSAKAQMKPATKVTVKKVRHVKHLRHHRAHKKFSVHKHHAAKAAIGSKVKIAKPMVKQIKQKRA